MSEREKLHAGIVAELRRGLIDPLTADAVIRLVVEACAVRADECQGGWTSTGNVLRQTFLPTPKENERG